MRSCALTAEQEWLRAENEGDIAINFEGGGERVSAPRSKKGGQTERPEGAGATTVDDSFQVLGVRRVASSVACVHITIVIAIAITIAIAIAIAITTTQEWLWASNDDNDEVFRLADDVDDQLAGQDNRDGDSDSESGSESGSDSDSESDNDDKPARNKFTGP